MGRGDRRWENIRKTCTVELVSSFSTVPIHLLYVLLPKLPLESD
jgi:hypothetical protein